MSDPKEIAWALMKMLDGVALHDLHGILGLPEDECRRIWNAREAARATLEAAPAPVVGAPTDEEIDGIFFEHCCTDDFNNEVMELQEFREGARAVLARFGVTTPAPAPVPVSERLPGAEDCNAEGRCWWLKGPANPEHDALGFSYHLQRQGPAGTRWFRYTHWLPAHSLPLPEAPPT